MTGGLCPMIVRRRPTLPQPLGCSTIGAERLNFRVRYGTGCFPFRYGRRNSFNPHKLRSESGVFVGWDLSSGREHGISCELCVFVFARVVTVHPSHSDVLTLVFVVFCTVLG